MGAVCRRCKKPLKTAKSIELGFGPVCKRRQEIADAEFEKKQVTIFEVFEYQEKVAQ